MQRQDNTPKVINASNEEEKVGSEFTLDKDSRPMFNRFRFSLSPSLTSSEKADFFRKIENF